MKKHVLVVVFAVLGAGVLLSAGIQDLSLDCVMPKYLVAEDLNRDGYPDLALACHSCNTVMLLPNLGNEMARSGQAFDAGQAVEWQFDDAPMALAVGDFLDAPIYVPECPPEPCSDDADEARPEAGYYFPHYAPFPSVVVVTQFQPGLARISPISPEPPMLDLVEGSIDIDRTGGAFATLTHVALADLTTNGAVDVVALDGVTPKIGIFLGSRDPIDPALEANSSYAGSPAYVIDLSGYQRAHFVAIADMDRDGRPDLVVAADGRILFFRNQYTKAGGLDFALKAEVTVGTQVRGLAVADFNRDGYLDVAAVDPEFGALSIVMNHGCWEFKLEQRLKMEGGPVAVIALDCDRTGLVDLAVAEKSADRVTLVMNNLRGTEDFDRVDGCVWTTHPEPEIVNTVEFVVSHSFAVGRDPVSLVAEDFNKNGILDIAVALHGGGTAGVGPAVQVIYNPCCCPDCEDPEPVCADPRCHRDICPELVDADPKG